MIVQLYSMYSERFDNAQVAYSKWLKTSKQFADLIKMIEVRVTSYSMSMYSYDMWHDYTIDYRTNIMCS